MRVLGIETSCDETAVALVEDGRLVAQQLATSADKHALFGGVVPELASREHQRMLPRLLHALLEETGVAVADLGGIGVARGPGLLGCLLTGVSFAKGLALASGLPLVGVNHLHAHLLAPTLEQPIHYPAIGLLVSGGHTELYLLQNPLDIVRLGTTLDDAAGEAFDKAAKQLGLPYPGGAPLDRLGASVQPDPTLFRPPYVDNDTLDFSFSGLKTAFANRVQQGGVADEVLAASLGQTIADTLAIKTQRALATHPQARSLVVAGGVAANSRVRATLQAMAEARGVALVVPSIALCTDNAAMIALMAGELLLAGLTHDATLDAVPRGTPVPWDYLRQGS